MPRRWSLVKARAGGEEAPVIIKEDSPYFTRPQWSPTGKWIACNTEEGLSLLSPDGKEAHTISQGAWLAYGWAKDGSRLYGIRRSDDLPRLELASIDIMSGKEQIITDLGPLPLANFPVVGFSRISDKSFATSIVRVRSDVWLLEGFQAHVTFGQRLQDLARRLWRGRAAGQR
jgi:hypothetical protein